MNVQKGFNLFNPTNEKYYGTFIIKDKCGWFGFSGTVFSEEDLEFFVKIRDGSTGCSDPDNVNWDLITGKLIKAFSFIRQSCGWDDMLIVPVRVMSVGTNKDITRDFIHAFKLEDVG